MLCIYGQPTLMLIETQNCELEPADQSHARSSEKRRVAECLGPVEAEDVIRPMIRVVKVSEDEVKIHLRSAIGSRRVEGLKSGDDRQPGPWRRAGGSWIGGEMQEIGLTRVPSRREGRFDKV